MNLFELPLERVDPRLKKAVLQEGALQPAILLLQQLALLQQKEKKIRAALLSYVLGLDLSIHLCQN